MAASHCSWVSPRALKSANCHGIVEARVGIRRSTKRAHDEQKAQSPS
jgi:hypothetical protein